MRRVGVGPDALTTCVIERAILALAQYLRRWVNLLLPRWPLTRMGLPLARFSESAAMVRLGTVTFKPPRPPLANRCSLRVKFKKTGVTTMAGKALRKRILADVAKNGGAEYIFDRLSSGTTLTAMAKEFECSREYLRNSLHTVPEYKTALENAKLTAADALVEQGLEMVDALDGGSSTQEIAATREKVQWRKFMAGSYNQERYGNRPQTNVTISVSDMHLDALRKVNADLAQINAEDRQREAMAIDADYEDVTDE
jgi:hypothetical protein